jgi:addiction module HigA family antidote
MTNKELIHPGGVIKDQILKKLGLSVTDAAAILGVGRQALSALINERASLSPEMALRIEKAFGIDMALLLKIQLAYDIGITRKNEGKLKVHPYKSRKQ